MNQTHTPVHVVAAVVVSPDGAVLIARRPDHSHQGGLWEFPGGKAEPGETATQTLRRELHEEVGIEVHQSRPLIRVAHDYSDKQVLLDVWRVDRFTGTPHGREGQPIAWVMPEGLSRYDFPAANVPIVAATRLPDTYVITPEPSEEPDFLLRLERVLENGARLLQLRTKHMEREPYRQLAKEAARLCHRHRARLLLNDSSAEEVAAIGADGIHLPAHRLRSLQQRPLPTGQWLAASCHNDDELAHAQRIGVDFVTLSPVQPTASHPEAPPLGWERFAELTDRTPLPVYALGGLTAVDRDVAFSHGAQGVAGIRAFW